MEIDAGVAIVPQATVQQEIRQGLLRAVQLRGKQFTRPLAIIHRKGRVLTPAMKKFIACLTGQPFTQETVDGEGDPAGTTEPAPLEI